MIEVENLVKRYGGHLAVDHLSFTVEKGCVCGFLGPNGAGKSTTINCILGEVQKSGGEITLFGQAQAASEKENKDRIEHLKIELSRPNGRAITAVWPRFVTARFRRPRSRSRLFRTNSVRLRPAGR